MSSRKIDSVLLFNLMQGELALLRTAFNTHTQKNYCQEYFEIIDTHKKECNSLVHVY